MKRLAARLASLAAFLLPACGAIPMRLGFSRSSGSYVSGFDDEGVWQP